MFRVGQKVVFVGFPKGSWLERWREWRHPIQGPWPILKAAYTVDSIKANARGIWITLSELPAAADPYWGPEWDAYGFRPAVATDISVFTEMLKTAPVKVLEDQRSLSHFNDARTA